MESVPGDEPAPWPDCLAAEHLRAAVRSARVRHSLRALARQVGVSSPTIAQFARGVEPKRETRRKFARWYAREIAKEHEAACAMLGNRFADLPGERRGEAVRKTLALVVEMHREQGVRLPPLIRALVARSEGA